MGFLVSQHGHVGAIPPPPLLGMSPLESMQSGGAIPPPPSPQKGYLSDTCAIPYENKANGCDTPLCDTISKGYCAICGGISHWAAKFIKLDLRSFCSRHFRKTREGWNCRFQKTPRTEGGEKVPAVWTQGSWQVCLSRVPEIPRICSISRFGKKKNPAIFPGLSRSFPREQTPETATAFSSLLSLAFPFFFPLNP